jgi:prepilin-type N-terminal cleavage/methylation domain-containing protein
MSAMKHSSKGFSMVEILVVLAIIAIISGIFFASQNRSRDSLALERAAHQVAQDLNRAMEFSLRTRSHTCATGTLNGYGVYANYLVPNSYIIFADCDGNKTYNADGIPCCPDDIIETRPLEAGVVISDTSPRAGAPKPGTSFTYEPPDPTVTFCRSNGCSGTTAWIELAAASDSSIVKTVRINNRGRVLIE